MNPIPETAYKFGCGRYVQGSGAVSKLPMELERLGKRAFVLTGANSFAAAGSAMESALNDARFPYQLECYGGVCCEENAILLAEKAKRAPCDIVLGAGGGRVLDMGKMVAHYAGARYAALPTSSSTCAAFTPLSVVYTPEGATITSWFFSREVDAVVVDTELISRQPPHCAAAGIIDAMAKWVEIRHHAPKIASEKSPIDLYVANTLAETVYKRLLEIGPKAYDDVCAQRETAAVQELAYLTIPATGLVSGCARGAKQSALAHLLYERARACFPKELLHVVHGELVGVGLKAQLLFHGQKGLLDEIIAFMRGLHMPETLEELGLPFTRERMLVLHADMAAHPWVADQPDGPERLYRVLEMLICG